MPGLVAIDVYVLVDVFVGSVATRVPGVRARTERWVASDRDWTAQAGWDLVAWLAMTDRLSAAVVTAARRIGPVVVDHSRTGCVTPAAEPDIERTLAHRARAAERRNARTGGAR